MKIDMQVHLSNGCYYALGKFLADGKASFNANETSKQESCTLISLASSKYSFT